MAASTGPKTLDAPQTAALLPYASLIDAIESYTEDAGMAPRPCSLDCSNRTGCCGQP